MRYFIIFLIIFMVGCTTAPPKIVPVVQVPPPLYCGTPPATPPLNILPTEPKAIFDANGLAWVGFVPKHYENMGINMEALLFTLTAKNEIIKFYKKCIVAYNQMLEASKPIVKTEE